MQQPIDLDCLLGSVRLVVRKFRAGGGRLLHIEDDFDIAKVIAVGAREKFSMEMASILKEAREELCADRYDLVLLDLTCRMGKARSCYRI